MGALSELWKKLTRSRRYRESFAASVPKRIIPLQIRVLRKQREWSQGELAERSALTQGCATGGRGAADPDYGRVTVNTLIRIGGGFDCVYLGRFIPFSELGRWYAALENETALRVPSFDEDAGFADGDQIKKNESVAVERGNLAGLNKVSPLASILDDNNALSIYLAKQRELMGTWESLAGATKREPRLRLIKRPKRSLDRQPQCQWRKNSRRRPSLS